MSEDYIPVFQYRGALSEADVDKMIAEEDEENIVVESFVKETPKSKRKGRPSKGSNSTSSVIKKKKTRHIPQEIIDEEDLDQEDEFPLTSSNTSIHSLNSSGTNSISNSHSQSNSNSQNIEYNEIIDDDDDDDLVEITGSNSVYGSISSYKEPTRKQQSLVHIPTTSLAKSTFSKESIDLSDDFESNPYLPTTTTTTSLVDNSNKEITLYLKLVGEQPFAIKINQNEPIKILVDKYSTQCKLAAEDMQLKQYGMQLDLSKSASALYLIDGDTLDVTMKEISKPIVINTNIEVPNVPIPTFDDSNKLLLILRCDGNSYKFKLGKDDAFEKLLAGLSKKVEIPPNKKVLFKFDGMSLDMKATPNSEGMDDEDLIDVMFK